MCASEFPFETQFIDFGVTCLLIFPQIFQIFDFSFNVPTFPYKKCLLDGEIYKKEIFFSSIRLCLPYDGIFVLTVQETVIRVIMIF